MKCPFCGEDDTRVIDSRPADDNTSIRRRRHCDKCQKRFTTYEKVEVIPFMVIKKDMERQPYDRSKIEDGILRSFHKRQVSPEEMQNLVDRVESKILARRGRKYQVVILVNLLWMNLRSLMRLRMCGLHLFTVSLRM